MALIRECQPKAIDEWKSTNLTKFIPRKKIALKGIL